MKHRVWLAVLVVVAATAASFAALHAQTVTPASGATTFKYAGGPVAVATIATNPTDWVVLTGAGGPKVVGVTMVSVCGLISGGAPAATLSIALLRRSTADSAGGIPITPANMTGNGVAATSSAVMYSANPTLGTAAGTVSVPILNASAAGSGGCVQKEFGSRPPAAPLVLRGAAQQFAINLQGISMPAGLSLSWEIEVVEQ